MNYPGVGGIFGRGRPLPVGRAARPLAFLGQQVPDAAGAAKADLDAAQEYLNRISARYTDLAALVGGVRAEEALLEAGLDVERTGKEYRKTLEAR